MRWFIVAAIVGVILFLVWHSQSIFGGQGEGKKRTWEDD